MADNSTTNTQPQPTYPDPNMNQGFNPNLNQNPGAPMDPYQNQNPTQNPYAVNNYSSNSPLPQAFDNSMNPQANNFAQNNPYNAYAQPQTQPEYNSQPQIQPEPQPTYPDPNMNQGFNPNLNQNPGAPMDPYQNQNPTQNPYAVNNYSSNSPLPQAFDNSMNPQANNFAQNNPYNAYAQPQTQPEYNSQPQIQPEPQPTYPDPNMNQGFNPNLNQNPGAPMDPYQNQNPTQNPYAVNNYSSNSPLPQAFDNSMNPQANNFAQNNPYNPAVPVKSNPEVYNTQPGPNYQESKSGNRWLITLGIFLVIGLLIATGILFWINYKNNSEVDKTKKDDTSKEQDINSPTGVNVKNDVQNASQLASTGGGETPASKSRINFETSIPSKWLTDNFDLMYVNNKGECIDVEICGPKADPDGDGVDNLTEYNFGLDPQEADFDNDGISDGNELYIYYTNPKLTDSDGDKKSDLEEILACSDPIVSTEEKFTDTRLAQIEKAIRTNTLSQNFIKTLEDKGAEKTDLTKGYIKLVCDNFGLEANTSKIDTTDKSTEINKATDTESI
jgi:hypothetical protein